MRIGEFGDQPEIEVTFDVPDPESGGTKTVGLLVHRGTTGVVLNLRHPHIGLVRGSQVHGIIDQWEGDTPITRVEIEPL